MKKTCSYRKNLAKKNMIGFEKLDKANKRVLL